MCGVLRPPQVQPHRDPCPTDVWGIVTHRICPILQIYGAAAPPNSALHIYGALRHKSPTLQIYGAPHIPTFHHTETNGAQNPTIAPHIYGAFRPTDPTLQIYGAPHILPYNPTFHPTHL